ncbi:MAG: prefoldin subunit 3 [archaeon]|nr:prefoldin subunit 3 [archaeon]
MENEQNLDIFTIEENQKKYSSFASSLDQKIYLAELSYEKLEQKFKSYENLEKFISKNIQEKKELKGREMNIDIGKGIYVQSKLLTNNIIIELGYDIYIEASLEEALPIVKKQKDILERKLTLIRQEIIKNKAYGKLTKILSEELNKINDKDERMNTKINSINI